MSKVKCCILKYGKDRYYGCIYKKHKKPKTVGQEESEKKLKRAIEKIIYKDKNIDKKDGSNQDVKNGSNPNSSPDTKEPVIKSDGIRFDKYDLTHGWKFNRKINAESWENCSEELLKFCENPARIKLALHLLSGSVERAYAKNAEKSYIGAGILHVTTQKGDNPTNFLRAAAESFARDLSCKDKMIKLVLPTYLPENIREERLHENAYITDTCKGKLRLPAAYPDAAVVLDSIMLNTNDVVKFVKGNRHCQVVIIDSVPKKLKRLVTETIAAKDLQMDQIDWDVSCLHDMTQEFISATSSKKMEKAINRAKEMVTEHLLKDRIKFTPEYHSIELYLATALLLVKFLEKKLQLEENDVSNLYYVLLNAVLPGIYTPPEASSIPIALTQENFPKAFQEVVKKALEDVSKFHVPQGQKWETSSAEPDSTCYGYLKNMDSEHTGENMKPSIMFDRKVFLDLFQLFCPYACSDQAQISKWLLGYIEGKDKNLAYCPPRESSKDSFGTEKSKRSVRLLINQLDFLSEEKRQELIAAFHTDDTAVKE